MKSVGQWGSLGMIVSLTIFAVGCNETTKQDVTAAHDKVAKEQQKLENMKREDARAIEKKKEEAARTANKPVVSDGAVERERERAAEREIKQGEKVQEAKVEAKDKEDKLAMEQSRDKFLIDCKAEIDLANRGIEKLETQKNAADEGGKKTLDDRIAAIKTKRDHLQKEIDTIRSEEVMRWTDHKAVAQKAIDELKNELSKP